MAASRRESRVRRVDSIDNNNGYHTYEDLKGVIDQLTTRYPTLCEKFVIGKSIEGRDLMGIRILNKTKASSGGGGVWMDEVKLVGNMHGDETVGREVLIRFAKELLERGSKQAPQQGPDDVEWSSLLNGVDVWILPSMNPDGFARGTRGNAQGLDLNRNFPDRFNWQVGTPQPEALAIQKWSQERNFVVSFNMHGGDVVANYPYDGNRQRWSGQYESSPDDDTFRALASLYANAHPGMRMSREFPGGITNGAAWYVLYGGMQDWCYLNTADMDITLELSFDKYPPASSLSQHYLDNRMAMLKYASVVMKWGVRGKTRTPVTKGTYISVAKIINANTTQPIDHNTPLQADGKYHRLLTPANWRISLHTPDGNIKSKDVVVPPNQSEPVSCDFL